MYCGEIFKFPSGRRRRFPVKWGGWRTWPTRGERRFCAGRRYLGFGQRYLWPFSTQAWSAPYEPQFLVISEEDIWDSGRDRCSKGHWGNGSAQGQELLGELSPALETAHSSTRKPPNALPGIQDLPATIIHAVQKSSIKQRAQVFGELRPDANISLGGNVHAQPQRFVHVFIQQTFTEDLLCAHWAEPWGSGLIRQNQDAHGLLVQMCEHPQARGCVLFSTSYVPGSEQNRQSLCLQSLCSGGIIIMIMMIIITIISTVNIYWAPTKCQGLFFLCTNMISIY